MSRYYLVDDSLLPEVPEAATDFDISIMKILKQTNLSKELKARKIRELCHPELTDSSAITDIIDLFPKQYRNKVKILMHYLKGMKLNDDGSFEIGNDSYSSLIDLIKYAIIPWVKKVPEDGNRFLSYLKSINVPNSVITSRMPTPTNWVSLYQV